MSKKKLRGRADWLDYEMGEEVRRELKGLFDGKHRAYVEIDEDPAEKFKRDIAKDDEALAV